MNTVFEVLSLPARREIIEQLRGGPRPVGELAESLGISQPVMSKQLRILRDAGFVVARVDGQRRLYELRVEPFIDLAAWLEPYRAIWERRLDLLGNRLDEMKREEEAEL